MQNPFSAPPEGAVQIDPQRALSVGYRSLKTPHTFASQITAETILRAEQEGRLGFSYYDKEAKSPVNLNPFTFVVLEVYAGVSGYDADAKINYWSSRAKDTRTEPLTVFSSAAQGAIAKGLYQDIKTGLPSEAKYTKFVKAYCTDMDTMVEIALNASAERGMQKAVAEAIRKPDKWEKVFILSIAQNDLLWGFALKGYRQETKEGLPYAGKGELYFSPDFYAGTVEVAKSPDLYAKLRELQQEERDMHDRYQAKYASVHAHVHTQTAPAEVQYTAEPINRTVTASAPAPFEAPVFVPGFPDAPPADIDDLPF